MMRCVVRMCIAVVFLSCALPTIAQQAATSGNGVVPSMVNFSGALTDVGGKPLTGMAGVTFSLYKDSQGGSPLWLETQNVQPDNTGHYQVMLGSTSSHGLPSELFVSGEARWLGVQVQGEAEQPRVLLLSVPYALKAGDAQTVGGLPASAFVMAIPSGASSSITVQNGGTAEQINPALGGSGTTNFIPLWTPNGTTLGNSVFFQLGSGATAKVGLGLTTPLATLDINGTTLVRGTLETITKGIATPTQGFKSNPLDQEASSYSSSTNKAVMQHFEWQAEPTGNNTSNPGATLNLLFGTDNNIPAETGLKLSKAGVFTFAAGQTFPGTGTVTSVGLSAPTSDFTVSGSPVTTSGTLALAWKVAPTSTDKANAIVKRDANGGFSAGGITATVVNAEELISFNPDGGEGILGVASGSSGQGVWGEADGTGFWNNAGPDGVHGVSHASTGSGVAGVNDNANGTGVYAYSPYYGLNADGGIFGVYAASTNVAVYGTGSAGIYGQDNADNSEGVYGVGDFSGSHAGFFVGDVFISGSLSKGGGSFKIDHPLDPANKYLYHSFVESPDMMDVYNGNVALDGNGEAVVLLPEWFETLNRDFRYQLTCIGGFAPVYVAQEVQGNRFRIAGGHAGLKISWQVTGIRQDAWANAHRIPVEQEKPERERGFYLHPELYGAPVEKRIDWARHPEMMKRMKEQRSRRTSDTQAASLKP